MRKHSPRKWLHAVLDLLPLVIIPIFAIYSHRHTIDSYSVTREKYEVVDFNQRFDKSLLSNGSEGNLSWVVDDYALKVNGTTEGLLTINYQNPFFWSQFNLNDKVYWRFSGFENVLIYSADLGYYWTNSSATSPTDVITTIGAWYEWDFNSPIYLRFENGYTYNNTLVFNFYNLTQMFGAGNEPTINEFNAMFPNDYYDYTLSKNVLVQNGTETLNNTDIGSQFVYALYTPIHDYFNLSNVGVFGQLYNWLQLNMFNGTAPISMFIVYHVILYEFIMDLIFLIYCVFMFIIDFTERLIDCLFDKSFGGGR